MSSPAVRDGNYDPLSVPPHNADSERDALGAALTKGDDVAYRLLSAVQPEDFYLPAHAHIRCAIADVLADGLSVDVLTVAGMLERNGALDRAGGRPYLSELCDLGALAANLEYHCGLIRECAARCRLAEVAEELRSVPGDVDPAKILESVEEKLQAIRAEVRGEEETDPSAPQWPAPLSAAAFQGLAGEIVHTLLPETEADEAGLLAHALVFFGNCVGHTAHCEVGSKRHFANANVICIGRSSKGRKGTAADEVRSLLDIADPAWSREKISTGLSSGEGVIHHVRDRTMRQEPEKVNGKPTGQLVTVVADPGVEDKRLLVLETEFAGVLKVAARDGNILSSVLRQAFDDGNLGTLSKNTPTRATGSHVSVVGHITKDELHKHLTETDSVNGFSNRFLWVCVRRSKELPDGGYLPYAERAHLAEKLNASIRIGAANGRLARDPAASKLWREVYSELSRERDGLWGSSTSRGEVMVIRLSLIYALLDQSHVIRRPHLEAALAFWQYCEASAAWIFGLASSNPLANAIFDALRVFPAGMTRNAIMNHFARRKSSKEIQVALEALAAQGRVRSEREKTAGRPAETWFAL